MIQHTKFIYLFIYLILYSSCQFKKEQDYTKKSLAKNLSQEKKVGKWVLLKSDKIGEWEKGVDYVYTKSQFENNFKDIYIEFTKDYIINSKSVCSGKNKIKEETLDFNINGTDEDRERVKIFLNEEFGLLEKDFRGLYNLNCEHPFNKIFDFGDKLLVREWGAFYYLFVKSEEREVIKTKGYNCNDVETRNIYVEPLYKTCKCDYGFSKCYSIFYNNSDDYYKKMLLKSLPKKDTTAFFGENFPFTEYKIYESDSIKIIINEEGGESEYIFKKDNNTTHIEFYAYPP